MSKSLAASIVLALYVPLCAAAKNPTEVPAAELKSAQVANSTADILALKHDMAAMRQEYEARLQALEARLHAAEAAAVQPQTDANSVAAAVPMVSEPASTPVASANAFNPSISLILSGTYTDTSREPSGYAITGIRTAPDAELGPGGRGFSLAETELDIAANIDPWLRGAANISLRPDDSVAVEEAYVQTTALDHGFTVKGGRFFSGVGYLNEQHAHTWDFVDNPLAYQAFLGTQYADDGVQARWLAPTDLYLELGAELGAGKNFPGNSPGRNGVGMHSLFAHTGGDIGISNSWRAGLSVLDTKANGQILTTSVGDVAIAREFSGDHRVMVADFIWKWAPNGNGTRTNFKLQGEYLRNRRDGVSSDPLTPNALGHDSRSTESGWYLQGIYQFAKTWRFGLRTERIHPDQDEFARDFADTHVDGFTPRKTTVMLDYNPSEFTRLRLQLARDQSQAGASDNEISLQYQMSLGAHGAHKY